MPFSRAGACITMAGIYMALRFAVPWVKLGGINPHLAIFLSVAVLMLAQLALVVSIAGLQMRPRHAMLLALPSAVIVAAIIVLEAKLAAGVPPPEVVLAVSSALRDLCLILFAASLGCALSFIIRERNILVPAAVFAALVDYWSVSWGPLSRVLEEKPEIAAAASVQMPTPVAGEPGTMIGIGDFVFLALFFGALYRFGMNVKGAFWFGYGLLTVSMLVVSTHGGALPALVPISIAVVGAVSYTHLTLPTTPYV